MTVRTTLALTAVLAALGATQPAAKRAFSTHVFQFRLVGSEVVPPVNTDALGSCTVTLDDATGAYTVAGDYSFLRGDVTAAHFHTPAPPGQEAPVLVGFSVTGGTSGTFSRSGVLTPAQVQDMLNGLFYVQLHSFYAITGELRGQVVPCSTAAVTTRNGSGANPLVFSSSTPPVLGTTWSATLDCTGHAPSVAVLLFYARPASGTFVAAGEVLVRTSGIRLLRTGLAHAGDVVGFSAPVPGDTSLCGLTAHAQAVVLGSPGARLTNALQLVLGQ